MILNELKNNLKKIREKRGFTQKEMSEKLGMDTVQNYQRLEILPITPNVDRAIQIANILGVSVNDIWGKK